MNEMATQNQSVKKGTATSNLFPIILIQLKYLTDHRKGP